MDKIAIIGGSGFKQFSREGVIFLERHGPGIPPHMVDHKKNVSDLKDSGVTAIIGICSVGSLKLNIEPGSIVIPHDYINLFGIQTYHDLKAVHITPGLDGDLRKKIIDAAESLGLDVVDKGVYIQTSGPRFETKAEIEMIKNFADIVGMTMANEATLAKEQGIKYACICSIDNYANGLADNEVKEEEVIEMQKKNKEKIIKLLEAVL